MRPLQHPTSLTIAATTLLTALWLLPTSVEAYILPAKYYLGRTIKAQSVNPWVKVVQTTHTFRNGKKEKTFEERLFLKRPGTLRVERFFKGAKVRVDLYKGGSHWVWKKGQATQKSPRMLTPKFDFLLLSSGSSRFGNLRALLSAYGVRYKGKRLWRRKSDYYVQKRVSLTWRASAPQIVLGAPARDRSSNQLWIHKNDFSISRFLGRLGQAQTPIDVRYYDYVKSFRGKLFPGRIEEWVGGKRSTLTLVRSVKAVRTFVPGVLTRLP